MERENEGKSSLKFKRICVFCGSSQGKKTSYQESAIELGNVLVARNIDLVYGGGSIGLMGLVSQAVHNGGRHVIGVIPKNIMPREDPEGLFPCILDHEAVGAPSTENVLVIQTPNGVVSIKNLLQSQYQELCFRGSRLISLRTSVC